MKKHPEGCFLFGGPNRHFIDDGAYQFALPFLSDPPLPK
jgi:hypothetical protein